MKNKFALIISSAIFSLITPFAVLAFGGTPGGGTVITDQQLGLQYGAQTGLSARDPRLTVALLVRTALTMLGTIVVVIMVYSGFLWMTAGGNDEKIGQAKGYMYAATIGLAIILSAYALATFVVNSLLGATGFGVIPFF